jgi:hypothetical protein
VLAVVMAGLAMGLVLSTTQVRRQASIASATTDALAAHPRGGPELEAAVLQILETRPESQPLHLAVRELLTAASGANERQMAAIGNAVALRARGLAETDFPAARALWSEVARVQNPALQRSFNATYGPRLPGLQIPSGTDGGGLDTISPS